MISYDNLWRTMKEKGITQYAFYKRYLKKVIALMVLIKYITYSNSRDI